MCAEVCTYDHMPHMLKPEFCFSTNNYFSTLSKKQQKYRVREETKAFWTGADKYNTFVDPMLFFSIYRLRYEIYQLKDHLFL